MKFSRLLLLITCIVELDAVNAQSNPGVITRTELVRVPSGSQIKTNFPNTKFQFGSLPEMKVGDEYFRIKAKDMQGNKVDSKNWKGKIVVINYWFIACKPCIMEIPELNELVTEFKNDSDIVFVAIGLDPKYQIKEFIKSNPYEYILLPDGNGLKGTNTIRGYPTNLILDRNGKIHYYQSGFGTASISRIRKSIIELRDIQ
jgi:peroxiredoxin